MPVVGQIQPNYLQPHQMTIINNNTVFEDKAAPVVDDSVKMTFVVASPKGRDGEFIELKNSPDYIKEFGIPKIDVYGQAGYMPYKALDTQMVTAKVMRVAADDATYSNTFIGLKVRIEEVVGSTPAKKKMVVSHVPTFQETLTNKGDALGLLEAVRNEDPDADNNITLPLICAYARGKGKYGDDFRVRISQCLQMDKENMYKNVRIEILGVENGLSTLGIYDGAIFPDALEGRRSIYIEDKVNDIENGSSYIKVGIDPSTILKVYNMYKTEVDPATTLTPETFDIFGFMTKGGRPIEGIEFETGAVALDSVEGTTLAGGGDGALDVSKPQAERQEALDALYIKAFKGEINRAILSRRRTPADVLLDANYSAEVKRVLIELNKKRNAERLYIDGGIMTTTTEAIDWATEMENIGGYILSKDCNSYTTRDPFTFRPIQVTSSYAFASIIPVHFKTRGKHIPLAGEDIKIPDMIPGTLQPVVDADDYEVKEELYTRRVNYFECIGENQFQRGTQSTADLVWSDLSEEHNVNELYDIKRIVEDYAARKTYNFAEATDRKRFTEDVKFIFADRIGTRVRSLDVEFRMTPWEEERSILHCYIAIVFRTIAKRHIIEIDINKRV